MTQQTQSGEERAMGENQLHVVFGTRQVGNEVFSARVNLG